MPPVLHGLKSPDTDGVNRFSFGLTRLLGTIWVDQLMAPGGTRRSWPYKQVDRRFLHFADASQRLVWKLDRVAALYADAAASFGRAVVASEPSGADVDLAIHLDTILVYLRILPDIVAGVAQYFYPSATASQMPERSFREHVKWFRRNETVDPGYLEALARGTEWFEQLAGKNGRGVRDLLIHRFATIQPSVITAPLERRGELTPSFITHTGYTHINLADVLVSIVDGIFAYLDLFVTHHVRRLALAADWDTTLLELPHACEFYRFETPMASHWLFPVRA